VTTAPDPRRLARAEGALWGLAIGDALGMPTQLLPRAEIRRRYGDVLDGFHPGPPDHPIAAGLAAGTVTDDTEQAVLVGRLLVEGGGRVSPARLAEALVAWERDVAARGSLDLLGPSTKRAVAAVAAGAPVDEAGLSGDTNGAAMRIAPVGIATAPAASAARWAPLVERVVAVSKVTHNTGMALAGAAAVAAAVSASIDGTSVAATLSGALEAARLAATRGYWVAGAEVAARIEWAVGLTATGPLADAMAVIGTLVGTSLATQESVPAAFAVLSAVPGDAWLAVRVAASLGGDTDTIAAMVGAMAGARHGVDAWPEAARRVIDRQKLALASLAAGLLDLRDRPSP
jgi:ADP-ribosylglycohydrolase